MLLWGDGTRTAAGRVVTIARWASANSAKSARQRARPSALPTGCRSSSDRTPRVVDRPDFTGYPAHPGGVGGRDSASSPTRTHQNASRASSLIPRPPGRTRQIKRPYGLVRSGSRAGRAETPCSPVPSQSAARIFPVTAGISMGSSEPSMEGPHRERNNGITLRPEKSGGMAKPTAASEW
jgi:hypothetical protein